MLSYLMYFDYQTTFFTEGVRFRNTSFRIKCIYMFKLSNGLLVFVSSVFTTCR